MKVVFASNYLNVHQKPFCDEMLSQLGEDGFSFVAGTPFNELRLKSGYEDMNQEAFVIRAYEDSARATCAALEADVLIGIPYSDPDFINQRMRATDKLTFACSERLLKRGLWFRQLPPKRLKVRRGFTRYKGSGNFHVLCASAFTSFDLSLFGFPSERCWKWGYFPKVPTSHVQCTAHADVVSIVWAARFIQWKRPYEPLQLSKRLSEEGRRFHLTMIGDGEMRDELEEYVRDNGLSQHVTMTGAIPNSEVHRILGESDIFLFSSDRNEGWGAVLSEAMGNSCAPVASSLIGSVPYLIQDGVNGRVYPDGDKDALYRCVNEMLDNPEAIRRMGEKAHETMTSLWNPCRAAESIIELSKCLLAGEEPAITDGPCSPASIVKDSYSWCGGDRG